MTTPRKPHDYAAHEREWQRQERARDAARSGTGIGTGDGREDAYRFIAQTLRTPPLAALPPDFAARTARLAHNQRAGAGAPASLLLIGGGVAAMLGLAALVSLVFGTDWLQPVFAVVRSASPTRNPWLFALLVGAAVSAGIDARRLRR